MVDEIISLRNYRYQNWYDFDWYNINDDINYWIIIIYC